ncbi:MULTISPECIES: hypothetical protein [unclassified Chamaesiphon]|nr:MULTISPECIES: hypothetical protein [unclassified Chamaesiphon]
MPHMRRSLLDLFCTRSILPSNLRYDREMVEGMHGGRSPPL